MIKSNKKRGIDGFKMSNELIRYCRSDIILLNMLYVNALLNNILTTTGFKPYNQQLKYQRIFGNSR